MGERPAFPFDHTSPEFARDPWSTYERLRAECPVAWTEAHGGFWVASRYDDVYEIARDDETFSSAREAGDPADGGGQARTAQHRPARAAGLPAHPAAVLLPAVRRADARAPHPRAR